MKRRFLLVVLMLSASHAGVYAVAAGTGTTAGMHFLNVSALDRITLTDTAGSWRQEELGGETPDVSVLSAGDRPGAHMLSPILRLKIESSALLLHRLGEIPQELRSFALRPTIERLFPETIIGRHEAWRRRDRTPDVAPIRLSLSVAEQQLDLAVVEYQLDPPLSLYHVAAIALGTKEDYARFTVSATDQIVVGTLFIGGSVYRVVPSTDEPGSLIYPIRQELGAKGAYTVSGKTGRIGEIESRHVQMAKIADMQPWTFSTTSTGALAYLWKGNIGELDFQRAVIPPEAEQEKFVFDKAILANEIEAYIDTLRVLTLLTEPVSVDIEYANADGFTKFRQIINGIPVRSGHYVDVDTITGRVRTLAATFYPSDAAESDSISWWSEMDAVSFALDTIAANFGAAGDITVQDAELSYVRKADDDLDPQWSIEITIGGRWFTAHVNAITGEAQVYDALQ